MYKTWLESTNKLMIKTAIIIVFLIVLCSCGNAKEEASVGQTPTTTETTTKVMETTEEQTKSVVSVEDSFTVPEYEGKPSVTINNNTPVFDEDLKTDESFETYGKLDKRGRCTAALANLSIDTQPVATEERGDISSVHPSGWRSGQGWERCHLIGWQLSAENDNKRNLVTGTHYMNVDGMLPYENEVAW